MLRMCLDFLCTNAAFTIQIAGEQGEQGGPGRMVALQIDLNVKVEPTVSNSPNIPSSVLSVLDLNAVNKLNINRDMGEATWSRKAPATKGALIVYVSRMWRRG